MEYFKSIDDLVHIIESPDNYEGDLSIDPTKLKKSIIEDIKKIKEGKQEIPEKFSEEQVRGIKKYINWKFDISESDIREK